MLEGQFRILYLVSIQAYIVSGTIETEFTLAAYYYS